MTVPKIGKYELKELLGKGGMAEVYRGCFKDEVYAIKILLPELALYQEQCERFLREARNCAQIDHPNVLRVFSIDDGKQNEGQFANRPSIVLEYIEGCSLQEFMERPVSWERALAIGAAISDGLAWAHSEGIIHRDLKPGNVMMASDGSIKVADWGLSKALEDEGKLTKDGTLLGTPKYMAPELIKGRPASVRSDLYALGVILYQLICDKAPITGRTVAEILDGQLNKRPVKLKLLLPDIPNSVSELVSALLEKDPRLRPPSAESVGVSLRAFLSAPSVSSSGPMQPETAMKLGMKDNQTIRKTKPSIGPQRKRVSLFWPALVIVPLVFLLAFWSLSFIGKEEDKVHQSLVLRTPRFQSLNSLVIPFTGPLNNEIYLSIGDGQNYGKQYGPLQTVRTISNRTKVLEVEIEETVPVDAHIFVKVRKVGAETRNYRVQTPSLPKEIEEAILSLSALRDGQMSQIYSNLAQALKKRKTWRVKADSNVASQLIEQAIDRVIGKGKVSTIAPWVPRILHKGVLPGTRRANSLEVLRFIEAWLSYEPKVPPLPWLSVNDALNISYLVTRRLVTPKGMILFAHRKAVDQYPLPAEAGGEADKVWIATEKYLRPFQNGAAKNIFMTTANAEAMGRRRPRISTYKVEVPFTLETKLKSIHRWPPREARLVAVIHCFVREFQLAINVNGKSNINVTNCSHSYFRKGQGAVFKFLVQVSIPFDPKALTKEKNIIKLKASSIGGTEAHDAVGISEIAIFTSPI